MSYRNARARNQDLSEAHVPDLMALDIEERSWMLRVAAGFNQMSAARALLTARASVDLVTYHACKGTRNALHEACLWRAAVDMVQLLLGHRADVNIKVQYQGHNRTARQIAEAKGFTDLVRCFEGGFGDASRSDAVPPHPSWRPFSPPASSSTPLSARAEVMSYRNARARNQDLSEAHVPDLMALDIEERSWMLRVAAGFNQMSAARALLTARASVDLVTYHACKGTRNALHEACLWRAAVDMVQLLLGHRADVNIKVQYQGHNRTARQIAEANGFTDLVRCFEGGFGDASRSDAVPPHPSWRPFSPPASSSTPLSARAEVMSYRNARARNQDLSEAHVPDLMALDIEERSWMLRVAAGFNQMSAARALLTARASVDLVTYHACKGTRNALHEACLWRAAVDMVQLLLGHRADVNIKVQYQGHNRTARQIAEANGFTDLVRCFEGGFGDASRSDAVPPHPSWRPFSPPASSATPLSARAEVMSYRNARARNQDLSEAHVPDLMALDIEERSWMLRVAAGFNQMSAARALLTARASVDLVTYHACKGTRNALHEACLWRAAVDMVQLLLGHRADVNIKVQYQGHNRTARQIAEAKGFTDLVRCFEGGFGDASRSDAVPPHPSWRPFSPPASSSTPLSARAEVMSYRNARARNQDLSEAHVPDLMALDIEERSWMLSVAAGFNQMSAARALLTARASVDLVTYHACKGTRNALHEACLWRAAVDMVQLLLGHRADVNIKVQYQGHNRTARQIAEANGFTDLVRCFEGAIFTAGQFIYPALGSCRSDELQECAGKKPRPVRGTCAGFDGTGHRGEIVDVARCSRLQPDVCSKSTAHCPGIS